MCVWLVSCVFRFFTGFAAVTLFFLKKVFNTSPFQSLYGILAESRPGCIAMKLLLIVVRNTEDLLNCYSS